MKHNPRKFQAYLFVLAGFLAYLPCAVLAAEESITVTTYYPSPYGVYSEMRLYPKADATCNPDQVGLMFYDNSVGDEGLKICGGSPFVGWQKLSGYWAAGSAPYDNDIYNTNQRNVGIGTVEPGYKLHVYSTTGPSVQPALILVDNYQDGSGDEVSGIGFRAGNTPAAGVKTAIAQAREGQPWGVGALVFLQRNAADGTSVTMSNEVMRITPAGNVGIGTNSPGTALDLNGAFSLRQMSAPGLSSLNQGRLYFDSTSKKFKISENGAAYVDLTGGGGGWTDDGTVVRLTTVTDKVGIGTTNPQFKLEVEAGSYDGLRIISTGAYPALRLDTVFASGSYKNWAIVTNIYNPGDFGILSSSVAGGVPSGIRFLINGYGNVGIGNNLNAGARLQIRGADDLNTSYALIAEGNGGSDGLYVMNSGNISIGYPAGPGPTDHFQVGEYGFPGFFTKRFGVQRGSNNLYAYGMYQSAWSDRRMKKDIQPQKDMLERIIALKPVTYFWKPEAKLDSKMHYGIIAQEAQEIFPTLVYEDADGHLNFQRDEMQFILIQAIKEQQAEIEWLKAEIKELKERRK